eukprot:TRINITY_DN5134_c0_g1_i1.p1 TRINITY_DN5134_c0_g1~~TRINITY_DN5134_c0_g1_i1.p1  ORF type:complete len:218 (-),score=24.42 TRINITY_DN5134_c0_g1_i1:274-927(-)
MATGSCRRPGPADLYHAAVCGDCAAIYGILSEHVHPDEAGPNGYLPLIGAAEHGHVDAVRALLEGNADVNKRDHIGQTALMAIAARSADNVSESHIEITKLLLNGIESVDESGSDSSCLQVMSRADVALRNPEGKTALDQASHRAIRTLLLGAPQSPTSAGGPREEHLVPHDDLGQKTEPKPTVPTSRSREQQVPSCTGMQAPSDPSGEPKCGCTIS